MNNMGDVIKAINSGDIRTFSEQGDILIGLFGKDIPEPLTHNERRARLIYLKYIIDTPDPVRLP